jgi:putative mRNA 3-end processing factor
MEIQFLGGASEVGRLGMLLRRGPQTLLFDYGMLPSRPPKYPIEAPPVDALLLSHAHLDHSGMIPWITSAYDIEVYGTPPSLDIADLLLEDSLKVADLEGFRTAFDGQDVARSRKMFRSFSFGDVLDFDGVEVLTHSAGHIPGATMFEVNVEKTVLFSGDLHTLSTDLVLGAKPVKCDILVLESTYAGRQHPPREQVQKDFLRKIKQVNQRGGIAIVPAFAVGRTQDIILTLARERFYASLNGMGKTVNSIYSGHKGFVRSVRKLKDAMDKVNVVGGRKGLERALKSDVIVTTSGMLDGGPVINVIEALREDAKSAILLTGYQVEGTNGRRLVEKGEIDIRGVKVRPKCEVQKFDFSAHAGHDDLVKFVEGCDPEKVVLMHGDNRKLLADALEGRECVMPMEGEWVQL